MRVDKKLADTFLEIVLDNADIQVLSSSNKFFANTVNAFLDYQESDLSFVDISLLVLSEKYQVYTFDEELEKAVLKR